MKMVLKRALCLFGRSARYGWLMFGLVLLMLVGLEASLRVANTVWGGVAASREPKLAADTRAQDYWSESQAAEVRWEPYVHWRRREFDGKFISINEDGIRTTRHNTVTAADRHQRPHRIFVFGGSTIWGTGARDEWTIPSLIARLLNESGVPVEVTNFGEAGYVSTQEVIMLMRQLQRGNVPDVVIFYDGVNDTFAAYQNGVAGSLQNESNRRREFNLLQDKRHLTRQFLGVQVGNLAISRFARRLRGLLKESTDLPAETDAETAATSEQLARDVVHTFSENMRLSEALGKTYGFQCLFYWQPVIFTKKHPPASEQQIIADYRHLWDLHQRVNGQIDANPRLQNTRAFHDISHVFDDAVGPHYIDYCHVTEAANTQVAALMWKDVVSLLQTGDKIAVRAVINPNAE